MVVQNLISGFQNFRTCVALQMSGAKHYQIKGFCLLIIINIICATQKFDLSFIFDIPTSKPNPGIRLSYRFFVFVFVSKVCSFQLLFNFLTPLPIFYWY